MRTWRYWRKINLKPFGGINWIQFSDQTCLSSSNITVAHRYLSAATKSLDLRKLFEPREGLDPAIVYENPWDSGSLRYNQQISSPALDRRSKYAIQLLQELYWRYKPKSEDQVTTAFCNGIIRDLGEHPSPDHSDRAHQVLENMVLLDDRVGLRLTMPLPLPDSDTYRLLLQLDSETEGPRRIAERCERLVREMKKRQSDNSLHSVPVTSFHWNCALSAWEHSHDSDSRAKASVDLLLGDVAGADCVNGMTALTALRCCVRDQSDPNVAKLGGEAALRVWKAIVKLDKTQIGNLPSEAYSTFLQAIRCLSMDDYQEKYRSLDGCFRLACLCGKVNRSIMYEFVRQGKGKPLLQLRLGDFTSSSVLELPIDQSVDHLLSTCPRSWKAKAD